MGPVKNDLMDDLAISIYEYLHQEATAFGGSLLVLMPITKIAKQFERNHRTITRRLSALKQEGLIQPIIKKDYVTLYSVTNMEDSDE
jgi:DNA-binding Lrp family transcriptional regulator